MNKITKKVLEYTAIFEPAEEGGYVVSVPALDNCMTQGETLKEATANIKDAVKGVLAVMKEEGLKIPQEKPKTVIKKISVANPAVSL